MLLAVLPNGLFFQRKSLLKSRRLVSTSPIFLLVKSSLLPKRRPWYIKTRTFLWLQRKFSFQKMLEFFIFMSLIYFWTSKDVRNLERCRKLKRYQNPSFWAVSWYQIPNAVSSWISCLYFPEIWALKSYCYGPKWPLIGLYLWRQCNLSSFGNTATLLQAKYWSIKIQILCKSFHLALIYFSSKARWFAIELLTLTHWFW